MTQSTVRIGFSTTDRILSRFIRWVSGSRVSHAWIVLPDPNFGCDMVLEAHETGFRLVPWDEWIDGEVIIKILPAPCDLSAGLKDIARFIGRPYDVGGLFGMAIVLIGRRFKKKWKNPLRSTWSVFCSEAVVRILQASDFEPARDLDPETIGPEGLLNLLEAYGDASPPPQ